MNNPCDKPETLYTATYGWAQDKPLADDDPNRTFWMVYVRGRSAPTKEHYDYNEALTECNRLAHKEIGRPVYILRAERYGLVQEAPVVWHECLGVVFYTGSRK